MSPRGSQDRELNSLDELIEEITVDAYGDDEQLWAFRQAIEDAVTLPAAGFVIGEPVSVLRIDYDGNERLGLRAKCRREDGSKYAVAVSDVVFPEGSIGARYIAAYRKWLGLKPNPSVTLAPSCKRRREVARMGPSPGEGKQLPSLKNFRSSVRLKGEPLSKIVTRNRREGRFRWSTSKFFVDSNFFRASEF